MSRASNGLAGLLAAGVALGATELVAGLLPGGRSVFVAVGDVVISLTPGAVVRFAISAFGNRNRLVLLSSMSVVMAIAGVVIGLGAARRPRLGVAGIGAFGALGAAAALADPLVPTVTALLAPAVGALAGIGALRWLLSTERGDAVGASSSTPEPEAPTPERAGRGSRRAFLALAGSMIGVAAVFAVAGRSLQTRSASEAARVTTRLPLPSEPIPPPDPASMLDVPGISPLVTPNDEFYRIDTAFTVPWIDPANHRLRITGMVDEPFELDYDELLELADTEADVTLACVSNEVGGQLVGNARWLGVPLADLLERAGAHADATQIVGRSVDGWTSGFPVEVAFDGRPALVAVGMNGEPLPARHGFPVRLVIAGLYGYVSDTKWLSEIEVTTFEAHDAYWIPRGWAERGPIKTQSRIDVPNRDSRVAAGTVAIAGVAWSDERGVTGVEVAVDGGPWQNAELADELATTSWRQWRLAWDATPGEHVLRVRALDADGRPQTAETAPPAPDGATGHHTVRITVA